MNGTITRSAVAIAAALTLATVGLTGCSGGGSGGPSGGTPATNAAPARTFTDNDLVKILTTANTTLSAGGTVTDNGVVADHPELSTSLYDRIKAQGGTMSPAACGPLFNRLTADLLSLGNDADAFSARLVYGSTVVGATSSTKPVDDARLDKLVQDDIDAMSTTCATMHFTFAASAAAQRYTLAFSKENAKTDAAFTAAYSEVTTVGATITHTVEVVGIDGNLLVGFAGISSATTLADGVKAVNAVMAAAKG
jgi:hypothetical protein